MNTTITKATIISLAAILLLTMIISRICIKLLIKMLKEAGCTTLNYRGKEITFAVGIAFVPVILTMSALCLYISPNYYVIYVSYLIGVCAMGFAGVLDDMIGEVHIKGLKSHINSFLHRHLTTGFIKAFIGVLISCIISIGISKNSSDFILNVLVMALFTNTLNLLDLRPGRCAKAFLLLGILIFISNIISIISIFPLGITLTIVIVYISYDLKELCILGDTGSNILGITLGFYSALCYYASIKLTIIFALLIINITAEKISITTIISKNRLLNYLDSLGRSNG